MPASPAAAPTILAFAPGAWGWPHFAGSPRYHLWTLAGLGWRVVYVEPPHKLRLAGKAWKAPDREFHVLSPGRVPPFAPRGVKNAALGEKWRRRTGAALAARGVALARHLGAAPDLYWLGAPWHSAVLEALPKGTPAVCHVYDELSLSPALSPAQRELLWDWERELLHACALALCSSTAQTDRREGIAPLAIHLPNGVRPAFLFRRGEPYPEGPEARAVLARLAPLPRPRYAHGGVADHRLNPELFRALLRRDREGSLVFLGKKDESLDKAFAAEASLHPRVAFLGEMSHDALAPALRACDVHLVAHRRSPFTDAMMPEKLVEYLATGRPVVSVGLPEIARVQRLALKPPALVVADEPEAWAEAAFQAAAELDLRQDLQQQRIAWAAQHTWDELGARADRALRSLLARRAQ